MEIIYIGHSCFKIKGKDATLVIDPYDSQIGYKLPKLEADVVLVTHDHYDHNNKAGVSGYRLAIDSPGEYELSNVYIQGIETFHDDTNGGKRGVNTMYLIDIDGFTILHTGDLGHELSDATLEKISNVDVLCIPVGGVYTIDAKVAVKVISSLEPGIVIPMHYQTKDNLQNNDLEPVAKFLQEMGVETPESADKLKLGQKSDIPDKTKVILLTPQH